MSKLNQTKQAQDQLRIFEVPSNIRALPTIGVAGNLFISPKGLTIYTALAQNYNTVEALIMKGTDSDTLQFFLNSSLNLNLKSLEISQVEIAMSGKVNLINEFLPQSLHTMSNLQFLTMRNVQTKATKSLSAFLKGLKLECLDLSDNKDFLKFPEARMQEFLTPFSEAIKDIKTVILNNCSIHLQLILSIFSPDSKVETLDLSNNPELSISGFPLRICEFNDRKKSLHISLNNCNLKDKAGEVLKFVMNNPKLELDLGKNGFVGESRVAISDLSSNRLNEKKKYLDKILNFKCNFSEKGVRDIILAFEGSIDGAVIDQDLLTIYPDVSSLGLVDQSGDLL